MVGPYQAKIDGESPRLLAQPVDRVAARYETGHTASSFHSLKHDDPTFLCGVRQKVEMSRATPRHESTTLAAPT